ncbi:MAG: peptidase MA family metallohydrolase, partial [Dehalococcoidia bacterium]
SPYGRLPIWLDEGLAMYNEGELEPHFRSRLAKAVAEGNLISVRSLCSPFSAVADLAYLSYAQSYSLVAYLLDDYGEDRMPDLLAVLKEGATYDEALIEVYGFDIDGLDANWRATLGNTTFSTEDERPVAAVISLSAVLAGVLVIAAIILLTRRIRRGSTPGVPEERSL